MVRARVGLAEIVTQLVKGGVIGADNEAAGGDVVPGDQDYGMHMWDPVNE
jgi:hypothetical protein